MATYKTKKPYMYGTGRRKSSVARVHLIPNGSGTILINEPPSRAAASPARPAPSATASPAPCSSSTRTTAPPLRPPVF